MRYKVGSKVWIANYDNVEEHTIVSVTTTADGTNYGFENGMSHSEDVFKTEEEAKQAIVDEAIADAKERIEKIYTRTDDKKVKETMTVFNSDGQVYRG